MKLLFIVPSAALLLATPAVAYEPFSAWSGIYVGAQVDYGWGRAQLPEARPSPGYTIYTNLERTDGVAGTLHGSYNLKTGAWVVGGEAELGRASASTNLPAWAFGDYGKADMDSLGMARLRAGYAVDNTLYYATGGLALAHTQANFADMPAFDINSETKNGWTLGFGAERALTDKWTTRVEYRYADFGRFADPNAATNLGWKDYNKVTEHVVRLGFNYKF